MQGLGKKLIVGILAGFIFVGCSSKINSGSSESSAQILNKYVKKDAPEGWFYNFGIGSNYNLALRDATDALSFTKPLKVETNISTSSTGFRDKDGYRQIEPEKKIDSKPYNVYNSDSKCEVIESWNVPEGILIVRICPDLQYFSDTYKFDNSLLLSYNDSTKMGELERSFYGSIKRMNLTKDDIELFLLFKEEMNSIGYKNFIYNYGERSNEEIIGFILNEYKLWYNNIGYINRQNKTRLGIFYPHPVRMDEMRNIIKPNQIWLLDGIKVSRRYQLSDAQVSGYSPIVENSGFKFVYPKN